MRKKAAARPSKQRYLVSGKVQGRRMDLLRLVAKSKEAALTQAMALLPMGRVTELQAKPVGGAG